MLSPSRGGTDPVDSMQTLPYDVMDTPFSYYDSIVIEDDEEEPASGSKWVSFLTFNGVNIQLNSKWGSKIKFEKKLDRSCALRSHWQLMHRCLILPRIQQPLIHQHPRIHQQLAPHQWLANLLQQVLKPLLQKARLTWIWPKWRQDMKPQASNHHAHKHYD